jgi:hypothetical protein
MIGYTPYAADNLDKKIEAKLRWLVKPTHSQNRTGKWLVTNAPYCWGHVFGEYNSIEEAAVANMSVVLL